MVLPVGLENLQELNVDGNTDIEVWATDDLDLEEVSITGISKEQARIYSGLKIWRAQAGFEIAWPSGGLESATSIEGAWNPMPDATSPYFDHSQDQEMFFRIAQE